MFMLKRNEMPRGCFIVFCGLDGSGKSTLLEGVRLWLDKLNFPHNQGRHPPEQWFNDSAIYGKYVLGNEEDSVDDYYEVDFTCGLRREIQPQIITDLYQKKVILYHRYIFSLFTYYSATKTVDIDYISKQSTCLLRPDLVFYCRIGADVFYKRGKTRGLLPFQQNEEQILSMIDIYDCFAQDPNWITIDTENCNPEESLKICLSELQRHEFHESLFDMRGRKIE